MKTNTLLLIAMMVIFAGCGEEKHKDVSGSCLFWKHNETALNLGVKGEGHCYITTNEAACSVLARGERYIYTIGGSCSR